MTLRGTGSVRARPRLVDFPTIITSKSLHVVITVKTCEKSSILLVEYCIVDFYIKKASIQFIFFVKLNDTSPQSIVEIECV